MRVTPTDALNYNYVTMQHLKNKMGSFDANYYKQSVDAMQVCYGPSTNQNSANKSSQQQIQLQNNQLQNNQPSTSNLFQQVQQPQYLHNQAIPKNQPNYFNPYTQVTTQNNEFVQNQLKVQAAVSMLQPQFQHKTFLDQAAYLDPLRYYQPHLYPNFLAAPPLVAEPFNPLVANTMERLVRQNYYMDAAAVHLQQQYALQQRQAAQQLQAAQQQATAAAQQSQALQRQQLQQQQLFSQQAAANQQQAVAQQQQQYNGGGKIREAASRSHQHQC